MYVFQADTYCDSCGERIAREIDASGDHVAIPEDSEHYPQPAVEEETDAPDHCADAGDCLESVDLGDYGLAPDAEMVGAESRRIGALLSDGLTDEGVAYLAEMLAEESRTPYQSALHNYWREEFADYLEDEDDN
jgi:hypothetical protein